MLLNANRHGYSTKGIINQLCTDSSFSLGRSSVKINFSLFSVFDNWRLKHFTNYNLVIGWWFRSCQNNEKKICVSFERCLGREYITSWRKRSKLRPYDFKTRDKYFFFNVFFYDFIEKHSQNIFFLFFPFSEPKTRTTFASFYLVSLTEIRVKEFIFLIIKDFVFKFQVKS